MNIVMCIILAVAGAVLYTFLNVFIRRSVANIRSREDYDEDVDGKMSEAEKKAALESKKVELEKKNISFVDTKKEYGNRFFIVSVLGAVLSGMSGFRYGLSVEAFVFFVFFAVITVVALVDMDTMEIPPELHFVTLGLGIVMLIKSFIAESPFTWINATWQQRLVGAICVSGFMFVLSLIIKGAFGFGDVKLMAAAGFLLGWRGILTAFIIGIFVGAAAGVVVIAQRKKGGKEHIPFGPSLCVGLVVASLLGSQLIDWYVNLLKSMMPNTYGY